GGGGGGGGLWRGGDAGAAGGRLLDPERLRRGRDAVEQDLDLVIALGPAVGLGDVELGHGRAGRSDRLILVLDGLAGAEAPLGGQLRGRRRALGPDRGVDRVLYAPRLH